MLIFCVIYLVLTAILFAVLAFEDLDIEKQRMIKQLKSKNIRRLK